MDQIKDFLDHSMEIESLSFYASISDSLRKTLQYDLCENHKKRKFFIDFNRFF